MIWSPAQFEALIQESPVIAVVVAAAAIWLLRRTTMLLVVAAAVIAWKFNLLEQIAQGYQRLGGRFPMTAEQTKLAEFGLGFLVGLVVLTALLHVRAFAQVALSVLALALIYLVVTESMPDIIAHAGAAIRHLQEYDLFIKGILVGKIAAGLLRWSQARRARKLRDWQP